MLYNILRTIYSIGFFLLLPFIFIQKLIRSRKNKGYRTRWSERLGFTPFKLNESIWVHSVSVGESIAISPLVKKLATNYPDKNFVITTMTPTGSEQVLKLYRNMDNIYHTFIPFDIPLFLHIFLKRISARVCIIMETEIWPNLIHICHKKSIPVILTNARLSEKSARGYQKIRFISQQMLKEITHINAQTIEDKRRFLPLLDTESKITVTGNLKYDFTISQAQLDEAKALKEKFTKRPIWVAASTHPGEDEIILKVHKALKKSHPDALLILVPRHPERFNDVYNLALQHDFITVRRSTTADESKMQKADIYLGDTMGEMMIFYALCDIAFVGGSFSQTGGHNMLEPASVSKAILSGPSVFNFKDVSNKLIENNALLIVHNEIELQNQLSDLFSNAKASQKMGEHAYQCFIQNQGALEKQFNIIKKYIDDPKTTSI
ncbi:lipid IV(A) 3-deoxy-D-manno-octulosonic acid transferase [Fangia hongkongensis]|uniref:lipid IV(A) 3-deoxy-D-manno-octulosonic acid transferase n=2 Tax=Fangia hongkongensis TaxID=270495 RepID=UPI00037BF7CD|nr:lipid IV(A) 3-deoxy-D-manno-octulosonic acid transferase [Fangia hongkongensis]